MHSLRSAGGEASLSFPPSFLSFLFLSLEKEAGTISQLMSFAMVRACPQKVDGVGGWHCSI